MEKGHTFLSAILVELTRRKVLRTVGGYAVAVFVLLQLMDAAVEPLRLPDWLPTLVVIVLILGFPLVFMAAWLFDVTSRGIRRTRRGSLLSRSQNTILFGVMFIATAGLGYVFFQYYSGVFEMELRPQQEQVAEQRAFTAPANSIAVLPFADLSAGQDQSYFSDGVAEEILNLLAQVEGLHVAARTSSFAFKEPQTDIREIGRLLNVTTVLEGSVRAAGNRIRLTAQLINVADGYHIWSQSYDRELDDIFAIQDEIASSIAAALVESFEGLALNTRGRAENLAASQAYRTGRLHWWRRSPDELQKAIEQFAIALEHDPQFAPAYAAMADTRLLLSRYGNIAPHDAVQKATPMIERALAIDPQSSEAFAALGLARMQIGQNDAAESAFRQAIQLDGNYIPAQLWLGNVLSAQGQYAEVERLLEHAMSLDPLNELLAVNYAANLTIQGDYRTAMELLDQLLELRPTSTLLLRSVASHKLSHGDLREGWELASRAYQLGPGNPADISALSRAWLALGQTAEAEKILLEGLQALDQNQSLMDGFFHTLLMAGRFEEAKSTLRDWQAKAGEGLPPAAERMFSYRFGMIAMLEQNYELAFVRFSAAIDGEEDTAYDDSDVMILTMTALAAVRTGNPDAYQELIAKAERKVQRARLSGVSDPYIHYSEATILALKNEPAPALEKLQIAYDQGFRAWWLIKTDGRLDSLRQNPQFIAISGKVEENIEQALAEVRTLQIGAG